MGVFLYGGGGELGWGCCWSVERRARRRRVWGSRLVLVGGSIVFELEGMEGVGFNEGDNTDWEDG